MTFLENRAYEAIATRTQLEQKKAKRRRRGQRTQGISLQVSRARQAEAKAIALAADIALVGRLVRRDILRWPARSRHPLCARTTSSSPNCVPRAPAHTASARSSARLTNQRDDLWPSPPNSTRTWRPWPRSFNCRLPRCVRCSTSGHSICIIPRVGRVRPPCESNSVSRFFAVSVAVTELADQTVRASSVIENLNSRLRSYFFLRRHLGPDYLTLLQFFLNHHRFLRSERPERVGKSPSELMTGHPHPHWLEMLGYVRFSRN